MKEVQIISDIENFNGTSFFKLKALFELVLKLIFDLKYVLIVFFLLLLLSIFYFDLFYEDNFIDLTPKICFRL